MVGVCALVRRAADGSCEDVRVAFTNMASTPVRATATEAALRGQALDAASIARGGRAGGGGHRAPGRPQRDGRLQAPPRARAHPAGADAGGGGALTDALSSPGAVGEALAGEGYLADSALRTAVFLAAELGHPLLLEGEAGVGKTEVAKALAAATGAPPRAPAVPRGHRRPPRPLRLGLRAAAAGAPRRRGRRGRGRALLAALPRAPPAARGPGDVDPHGTDRAPRRRDRPGRRRRSRPSCSSCSPTSRSRSPSSARSARGGARSSS